MRLYARGSGGSVAVPNARLHPVGGSSARMRSPWLMGDAPGARWRAGGWARALSEHLSPLTPYESGRSWGGHSCRRGGAQFLARRGCPVGTIKWMGRWGSDAVLKYIEELEQPDAEVAAKALRASG